MMTRMLRVLSLSFLLTWPLATAEAQRIYCEPLGAYYPNVTRCPVPWLQTPNYRLGPPGPYYPPPPGADYAEPPPYAYPPPPPDVGYAPAMPRPGVPPPARESSEEQATANRAYGAEIGMRREQDAAEGYRDVTVAGAISRFKSLGNSGVIITGYYARADRLGTLADHADETAEERVFVEPGKLPRAGRNMLADCAHCRITIWARRGCAKSALGDQATAPCLVIERVKKDSYEANTPIFR
jgi:hypothetical protein